MIQNIFMKKVNASKSRAEIKYISENNLGGKTKALNRGPLMW